MYLSQFTLLAMGFKSIGQNVLLSDKATLYNVKNISIGSNVRIDDFCILSAGEGGIEIGSYVHIAAGVKLIGKGKIVMEDFTAISINSIILSSTEPYDGTVLTNPTIKTEDRNIIYGDVIIKKFSLIGASTIIMPKVTMHENSCVGAMSLVKKDLQANMVYAGIPCKEIAVRKKPVNIEQLLLKYKT